MAIGTVNNYRQTNTTDKINTSHHWGEAVQTINSLKNGNAPERLKGINDLMQLIGILAG